jgi:RIO kinase 2
MSLINGLNLNRYKLPDPKDTLDEILENVRLAYEAGVIHADLSEYNILVEEGKCIIIDWPQWMETNHPNADTVLARDVNNILAFFVRKYKLSYDPADAVRCVTG